MKPVLDPAVETAVRSYRLWLQARGVPPPARVCFTSRLRRYLRWFQILYRLLPLPSVVSGQAVYLCMSSEGTCRPTRSPAGTRPG